MTVGILANRYKIIYSKRNTKTRFEATLAKLLQGALPAGSNVEVVARGGGVGNPLAVDMGTLVIAQKDLPEDLAYLITKTLCENKE